MVLALTIFKNQIVCLESITSTENVTGETLVLKKHFASFMLGKSLLYAGKTPIFPTFSA